MLKLVVVGATTIFVTASTLAHAQAPSAAQAPAAQAQQQLSAEDWGTLTDARINLVKAALQLTPDQEKLWPAVEDAIRLRAEHRQSRVASRATRTGELRNGTLADALRNRNPIEFLHRRADALTQRGQDLNNLANAWQPLYQTLKPDQKQRMALLTVFVFRNLRNAVEQRVSGSEEGED